VLTKSGAEKWIQGSSRVTHAEGGEVTWDGFLVDITERKHAEEKLRITEERHLLAMKAAAETSFTWDIVEDDIFLASREGGFFGIDPASVKCVADWHKHVHPEDLDHVNEAIVAHLKGLTERLETEYRIFDNEGKIRQVRQLSIAHRNAEGRATWLAGAIVDITDEVEAKEYLSAAKQAAEEASASKSEFLANMSHELRTPLNAIIGYSEILLEEAEERADASSVSDLGKIQTAGRHLLSLINNVLDVSKIEAGKIDIFLETFDVAEMFGDVATTIQPLAEQNSNAFEVDVPDNLGTMHSDITKVRQTLFNLLSNACKFTSDGEVTLGISREQEATGDALVFSVSDTGVGMTPEQC
jgi:signal transduction histidine kinase